MSDCLITRALSRSAIAGKLALDALELITSCTRRDLRRILGIAKGNGNPWVMYAAELHGNIIRIIPMHNEYLGLLAAAVSRFVPSEGGLEELIRVRERVLRRFLDEEHIPPVLLSSLGIGELSPLLTMRDIEDIYITHDSIYANHASQGMCKVLGVDPEGLGKRILKLANISGGLINIEKPSGKFSIRLGGVPLRFTVDMWPIVDSVSVHIRRHKRIFTITDLVRLGTLSKEEAARLILAVRFGYSVIIMGPPSSGKTTLLNALDMVIPPGIRRIYIDEADESLDMDVPSIKVRSIHGKVEEVLKSLHRGLGVLFIGELREEDHFRALIHGRNSGLQVMATTHAVSKESLVRRLRVFGVIDNINLESFVTILMGVRRGRRILENIEYPRDLYFDDEVVDKLSKRLEELNVTGADYARLVDELIEVST